MNLLFFCLSYESLYEVYLLKSVIMETCLIGTEGLSQLPGVTDMIALGLLTMTP